MTPWVAADDSAGVKILPRIAVTALSIVALAFGLYLGLRPVTAPLTQVSPVVRELTVTCGIGFLPTVPPAGAGDLVTLPSEPGVALPRATYAEHCAGATSWRPYVAWGLTGLGIAGLAVILAARRVPPTAG